MLVGEEEAEAETVVLSPPGDRVGRTGRTGVPGARAYGGGGCGARRALAGVGGKRDMTSVGETSSCESQGLLLSAVDIDV